LFENRVLRGMCGPKRKKRREAREDCIMRSIPVIKSRIRWAGHVVRMGDKSYNVLGGKPEEKRPLGRHGRRWEDNSRMDLGEIRWEDADLDDMRTR
jgi:hypothetical protein